MSSMQCHAVFLLWVLVASWACSPVPHYVLCVCASCLCGAERKWWSASNDVLRLQPEGGESWQATAHFTLAWKWLLESTIHSQGAALFQFHERAIIISPNRQLYLEPWTTSKPPPTASWPHTSRVKDTFKTGPRDYHQLVSRIPSTPRLHSLAPSSFFRPSKHPNHRSWYYQTW